MDNREQSAFPIPGIKFGGGLTKMEWFMTHAPKDIPEWFEHSMETNPEPKAMRTLSGWMSAHKYGYLFKSGWDIEFDDWIDGFTTPGPKRVDTDPIFEQLKVEALEYLKKLRENLQLRKEWEAVNQYERYFQWRIYYARKMCAL